MRYRQQLGLNVKKLRKGLELSQSQLADHLSIDQTAVSRVEAGNQNLTPFQLLVISNLSGVSVDTILREKL